MHSVQPEAALDGPPESWLGKVHLDQAGRVRETVRKINRELSESTGDTPAITISVGAAFWNRKDPGPDIFKDADTALLQVKKHGKSSCEIYGAETEQ